MTGLFLKLLNMSIAAGWLILAILLVRLLLTKAPKRFSWLLWLLAAVRLAFPLSVKSFFSLIPSAETIPSDIEYAAAPAIHSGIEALNSTVNPVIGQQFAPQILKPAGQLQESAAENFAHTVSPVISSVNPMQVVVAAASWVWIAGMVILLIAAAVSLLRLRAKVRASLPVDRDIYICDDIDTPFLLGLIRPRIYLPSHLNEETRVSVIAHEKAHIKSRHHWWKAAAFLILILHWFNPLVWAAFLLFCRDIELSCDETVVEKLDLEGKKRYSKALLSCADSRRLAVFCPLAFG